MSSLLDPYLVLLSRYTRIDNIQLTSVATGADGKLPPTVGRLSSLLDPQTLLITMTKPNQPPNHTMLQTAVMTTTTHLLDLNTTNDNHHHKQWPPLPQISITTTLPPTSCINDSPPKHQFLFCFQPQMTPTLPHRICALRPQGTSAVPQSRS